MKKNTSYEFRFIFMILYLDSLIIPFVRKFASMMHGEFERLYIGDLNYFLELQIKKIETNIVHHLVKVLVRAPKEI